MVDVLCVGQATYDLIFEVPHHPQPDEKTIAENLVQGGGGPAANAAVGLSRLGYKSAFAGYLGSDHYGDLHQSELRRENVNLDLVLRGNFPTPLSVCLVKPDGTRSLVNYCAERSSISYDNSLLNRWKPEVLLFDGHEPELSLELLERFRGRDIQTILDAGSVHRGTVELAPRVDYLVSSQKFAYQYTGEKKDALALEHLAQVAGVVVITLGERGLIWKDQNQRGELPAFQVQAVDTTGAGDAFHAGFAAGILDCRKFDDILRYASVVASLSCTKTGARESLPTKDEVQRYMDTLLTLDS